MRGRWMLVIAVLLLLVAACGGGGAGRSAQTPASPSAASGELSGNLTVFAAASLTDAFDDIASAFKQAHPGVQIAYSFAGSQVLAGQIGQGAPADVFASASKAQMDVVVKAGRAAGAPRTFTGNVLEIAVEPGNPKGVRGLADLARPDLKVVLAAPEVPAGQYAAEALRKAGVEVKPVSLDNDVRSVSSKVQLGEADVAIMYHSDVVAAGDRVEGVEIPAGQNVPARYPIVALTGAPNPGAAAAFIDFVLSEEGQLVLRRHGFATP
ncbi:MAG: molybdate ABC transporter substrate-binding protein [Egibacteraceae bacterium]